MKPEKQQQARALRTKGASIQEIATALSVSKSSVSLWVRGVTLAPHQQLALQQRKEEGRRKGSVALQERTRIRVADADSFAQRLVREVSPLTNAMRTLLLATYYWCEGNKSEKDMVFFTNSDPDVVCAFVALLRTTFVLDESRFRVCLHLHDYHDPAEEMRFWSELTSIPAQQFLKPYHKPHTQKRIRAGYRGCAQIRYYDVSVARKLLALGRRLNKGVGAGVL